ncbi:MAG: 30S ribosomal protein S2 [Salinibacter sp.]|uniref:30S ribosomal protein S2 n=1 Tax=Salinibacter sp. TaxID=2065818 RepID=UPI0035D4308C
MADETSTQDPDVRDDTPSEAEAPPENSSGDASATEAEESPPQSTDAPGETTEEPETEDAPGSDDEAEAAGEPASETSADETETTSEEPEEQTEEDEEETSHRATVEELLKAGAHFGHLTSRWNPRMEDYIFMERNNIHIIDLMQTQVLLDKAAEAAKRFARRGKKILFAGTKKQAQDIVREHAEECGMPHMVDRWLGGTMTNFQTIRKSIRRMEEIERMERDGTLDKLKKKEKLMRLREHEKLENTLGGIRDMVNLPGAIYIVDVERENIAVSEAQNLGIPIIAMVDTNGNPKNIDYPVPVNDDALSSIELVTSTITDAIEEGLHERKMKKEEKKKAAQG